MTDTTGILDEKDKNGHIFRELTAAFYETCDRPLDRGGEFVLHHFIRAVVIEAIRLRKTNYTDHRDYLRKCFRRVGHRVVAEVPPGRTVGYDVLKAICVRDVREAQEEVRRTDPFETLGVICNHFKDTDIPPGP